MLCMSLLVKLSASLRNLINNYDPMKGLVLNSIKNETVTGLLTRLGIEPDLVKIIMVNGEIKNKDTLLRDGDRVAFFPPVGGG